MKGWTRRALVVSIAGLVALAQLVPAAAEPAQAPQPGAAEGAVSWQITGTVTNPYGVGIPEATVEAPRAGLSAATGPDGRFRLEGRGSPGTVQIVAYRKGYVPKAVNVLVGANQEVRQDLELAVDPAQFRQALDDVKVRLYREGGFSPTVWFIPRLGLVVRYTRPELRSAQDRLFEMFSAVLIAKEIMAPFPYLHDGNAQLISEAVTPSEHLLRRYPRGPLLEMLAQGTPDLQTALAWTEQHYEFYRNGRGQAREIPGWEAIQKALDAVTAELFQEPEAGGLYVPGYGLVFNAAPAPQFPPVTALSVLSMLLAVRVPVPEGDRIFVQLDDRQSIWALEAPVQTLRRLLETQRQEQFQLDLESIRELHVYRDGMPWGL